MAVLIGERPGLTAPDSMGAYLTWQPGPQTTDADRNCISNIRPDGIGYADAAFKLAHLLRAMRARRISGVQLKDDSDRPAVGATIDGSNVREHRMKTSTDRILTTHTGSLPRPKPLMDLILAARRATPSTPPPSRPRPSRRSTRWSRCRSRTASTSSATAR